MSRTVDYARYGISESTNSSRRKEEDIHTVVVAQY